MNDNDMVSLKDIEIIKHSAAIHITNKVSLIQKRTWNFLLLKSFRLLKKQDLYRVEVKEYCEKMKFNIKNIPYLRKVLKELTSIIVEWNIFEKDKTTEWGVAALLSEVKIKNGYIIYGYAPSIRENLDNPTMYAKLNFLLQNKFKNKYAEFIWELCTDIYDVKRGKGETKWIPIEKFRAFLGIEEDEWILFKYLKRDVLMPAKKEINEISDLIASFAFKKEGRKIAYIKLMVKGKDNAEGLFPNKNGIYSVKEQIEKIGKAIPSTSTTKPRQKTTQQQTAENGPLASLLQLIPEDQRRFITASRLITASYKRYGYEYTKANALYTAKHSKGGYCGYLRLALTNNYAKYQIQPIPAPKQSTTKAPPKPKPPKKWPMIDYLGQIVDLSIFQHSKEGYSTIVAFDEKTDVLTAFQLYRMYKIDDPKIKVLKKMPDLMPQTERLPTVKYKGYTVDLEEHRYIIGNGTIVVGKDLNKRGLNYASLLRLYRKGEVEVLNEYETNHTQETGEEALV